MTPPTATSARATSPLVRPSVESYLSQSSGNTLARTNLPPFRFVRLSHNRRYLHYADFDVKTDDPPGLAVLENKVALASVSSVVSNVFSEDAINDGPTLRPFTNDEHQSVQKPAPNRPSLNSTRSAGPGGGLLTAQTKTPPSQTTITILGTAPQPPTTPTAAVTATTPAGAQDPNSRPHPSRSMPVSPLRATKFFASTTPGPTPLAGGIVAPDQRQPTASSAALPPSNASMSTSTAAANANKDEHPLLTLHLASATLAAEWLDGLLMLMNQAPITAETNRLVDFVARYGLKIRLLNVRFEEALEDAESASASATATAVKGAVPRDGEVFASAGRNGDGDGDLEALKVRANGGGGGAAGGAGGTREARSGYRGEVVLPGRQGVDDEFFYDVAGAAG